MTWDPAAYLKFGGERTRPAADLLARVPLDDPKLVIDLGCGPGNSTSLLAARYPDARLVGMDSSEEMLARARKDGPKSAEWLKADIAHWQPGAPADLFFANALFHWIANRDEIFLRLLSHLRPGGALAVQMPRNEDRPIASAIREAANSGPWRAPLASMPRRTDVDLPAHYHRLLRAKSRALDIWETSYLHALTGDNAVFEWVKATALTPYLETLDGELREGFLSEAKSRLAAAYPPEPSGLTLFPFRRIFIVARI